MAVGGVSTDFDAFFSKDPTIDELIRVGTKYRYIFGVVLELDYQKLKGMKLSDLKASMVFRLWLGVMMGKSSECLVHKGIGKHTEKLRLYKMSKSRAQQSHRYKDIAKALTDKEKEIEILQEQVMLLDLQIKEKEEKIHQLTKNMQCLRSSIAKESVRLRSKYPELCQRLQEIIAVTTHISEDTQLIKESDQTFEKDDEGKSTNYGDTGSVRWSDDNNYVHLISPNAKECEDVMNRLMKKRQTGKKWWVYLQVSSPENVLVIIKNINKCIVSELHIKNTPLDSTCISTLAEILSENKTLKILYLHSTPLTGDSNIKEVIDVLSYKNTTLESLRLCSVTGITYEDITHLSDMISNNKTLTTLQISDCNITDKYVKYVSEGLAKNQTLTTLSISANPQITSASTDTIVELIKTTKSLTVLYLHDHTSFKDDDIKTICTALTRESTIQKLYIAKEQEEYCKTLDIYQSVKDKVHFW